MSNIPKMVPVKDLLDTGLLFEINRRVLHPLGMALAVSIDDDPGEAIIAGVWDCRDDPEGIRFTDELFSLGIKKYEDYLEQRGNAALAARKILLGYLIQGE